jgi:Ca2+-binding RTX toxin-like protein
MAVALVMASGVALAKRITCRGITSCLGTNKADTMTGTKANNHIYGKGGADVIGGGEATDHIYGGPGDDIGPTELSGGYDSTNDFVYGSSVNDKLLGGSMGLSGGVDHLYGGKGDDNVQSAQRDWSNTPPVTREAIDRGAGNDTVYFDEGINSINNCEIQHPYQ